MRVQTVRFPILPPSVNHLFASVGRRRVKTADYKAFLSEAIIRIRLAMKPVETYPASVVLTVYCGEGFNMRRDAANFEKAVGDSLVDAGILKDDSIKYVSDSWQRGRPSPTGKTYAEVAVIEGHTLVGSHEAAA